MADERASIGNGDSLQHRIELLKESRSIKLAGGPLQVIGPEGERVDPATFGDAVSLQRRQKWHDRFENGIEFNCGLTTVRNGNELDPLVLADGDVVAAQICHRCRIPTGFRKQKGLQVRAERLLAQQRDAFFLRGRILRQLRDRHAHANSRPQITQAEFAMLQIVGPLELRTTDQALDEVFGVHNATVLFSNRQGNESHKEPSS